MINTEEIRITEDEATTAAYGNSPRAAINPVAIAKRRFVAEAQLSKALWNIVDQLPTEGSLAGNGDDDLTAAAILEQIAILLRCPHPTTQEWYERNLPSRIYLQTADPVIAYDLHLKERKN